MRSFRNITEGLWKDRPVVIYSGYDNPMGWFFMVVKDENPSINLKDEYLDSEEGLVYSNLIDDELPDTVCDSPEYFFKVLDKLGITVEDPERLFKTKLDC